MARMAYLVTIGVALIIAGFIVVFWSMLAGRPKEEGGKTKGGAVILIGPIPIVFGSDAKWASIALVLAILLIVVVLLSGFLA